MNPKSHLGDVSWKFDVSSHKLFSWQTLTLYTQNITCCHTFPHMRNEVIIEQYCISLYVAGGGMLPVNYIFFHARSILAINEFTALVYLILSCDHTCPVHVSYYWNNQILN